jgi:ribosomal protein S1
MQDLAVDEIVDSKHSVKDRVSHMDVREGDRFLFRIQDARCPLGGIWLEPLRSQKSRLLDRVWQEIEHCYKTNTLVRGRVLNRMHLGHAVGVAGHVGVLRLGKSDPRRVKKLGALQEFVIISIDPHERTMELAHEGFERREYALGVRSYQRYSTPSRLS